MQNLVVHRGIKETDTENINHLKQQKCLLISSAKSTGNVIQKTWKLHYVYLFRIVKNECWL